VLADLGDDAVIAEARRRYAAQDTDPKAMPAELRKTILAVVAAHADAATWDKLHATAKNETTPLIKDQLYSLLSIAEDDALAQRALDLAITDEPGATNSSGMIAAVAYHHPDMAFDFAMAHRAQVDKLVDSTSSSRYYPALGGSSFNPAMIDKINTYANAHIAAGSRRVSDTVVGNIRYRIMVRNERMPAIDAWLEKNGD
jgi:ERAP1-like C-terminal domain